MRQRLFLLTFLFGALTAIAAPLELTGIYVENGQALFVLLNPATAVSSHWLSLGQEFEGYTLKAFQSEADTIVLTKDGVESRIGLRAAKVKYAATALTGTIQFGDGAAKVQRATLVFGEETTFPVKDGLTLTIKPTLRPDGTIAYRSYFEQTDRHGAKQKVGIPTVVANPGEAFSMSVGDLGFSLTP